MTSPIMSKAGTRQSDQQGVDVRLPHAVVGAGLANEDPFRIAAREVQHLGAHQPIMHDDIGLTQQTQGAQGQQIGRAWPGTDQEHHARRGGALGQRRDQGRFGRFLLAGKHEVGDATGEEALQHPPARRGIRQPVPDLGREPPRQRRQAAERRRHHGLDPLAQQAGQHRRHAGAGDVGRGLRIAGHTAVEDGQFRFGDRRLGGQGVRIVGGLEPGDIATQPLPLFRGGRRQKSSDQRHLIVRQWAGCERGGHRRAPGGLSDHSERMKEFFKQPSIEADQRGKTLHKAANLGNLWQIWQRKEKSRVAPVGAPARQLSARQGDGPGLHPWRSRKLRHPVSVSGNQAHRVMAIGPGRHTVIAVACSAPSPCRPISRHCGQVIPGGAGSAHLVMARADRPSTTVAAAIGKVADGPDQPGHDGMGQTQRRLV